MTMPPSSPTGLARTAGAAQAQAQRIAAMITGLDDIDVLIPGSEWSVAETAAHLAFTTLGLAMMARGLAIPYGDGTREGLAGANAVALEGFSERDGAVLARELEEHTRMVFDEAAVAPPDRICPTPMGEVGIDGLTAYVLTHQAMHGSAIARAAGSPPPFEPDDVELMWPFIAHVLPRVASREAVAGLTACVQLAFGDRFSFAIMFNDGEVTTARLPGTPVDCRISGDPRTLFCVLVRMLPIEDGIARGDLTLDGPRPDVGRHLADFFDIP